MPVGKNFKKGRSNLKKKSVAGGGGGGVKLSHGKAGGNIKYTKKKPDRVLVGANVKRERIRIGPKEEIERKVELPEDFKEVEHLRLEDELANLDSDSDYEASAEEESANDSGGSDSGSGEAETVQKRSVAGVVAKKVVVAKKNNKAKKNQRHIRYKKKAGNGVGAKDGAESDSDKDEDGENREEKSKRVQLLADKMTEKHVQMSIQILKQVDPKQELPKDQLIAILSEMQDQSENILFVETVGFLLESLENLEEKLEEVSNFRKKQEKKLKAKRIDGAVFKHKISLDLGSDEEPEPDENDRIFCTGKKIYSGKHKLYMKPDKKQEREIARKIKPKKINPKLMNKYKYID